MKSSDEPVKPLVGLLLELTLFSVLGRRSLCGWRGSGLDFLEPQAMHPSATLAQSVPGDAFPFPEQTKRIQKRTRP